MLPLLYDDYNYWAFGVFTNFLLRGQNPYHIVTQDPTLLNINPWRYPPLYLLFTSPALVIRNLSGQTILYLAALKIPLAVADLVSAFFLYRILMTSVPARVALVFSVSYAFNPLVIFASSGGGFNDPIAIAFTVASAYYLMQYRNGHLSERRDLTKSALFLGLGIATKIYPILLIPVFLLELKGVRSRTTYAALALVPPIVFSLPFFLWDPISYIELLTVRSVGGQHPLLPGLGQGTIGAIVLVGLAALLLAVYTRSFSLISRIALTFLWINLAIFSVSFNYMTWGIPFFTLFAAQFRKHALMPISPILTLIASFIFEGSYDALHGTAGLYYWTFHILHQAVVPTLVSQWLGTAGFWILALSEGVTAYYYVSLFFRKSAPSPTLPTVPRILAVVRQPRRRAIACLVLLALAASSWTIVATRATFLTHNYPVVDGSSFQFTDDFRSSLIDYQWVFPGRGSYTINPSQGYVILGSPENGTGQLLRGWGSVNEGFHPSTSAEVALMFRFDGFSTGAVGITLANFTDGELAVQTRATEDIVYVDRASNATILLRPVDDHWHNFTLEYREDRRILTLDGANWILPGATFNQLILGDNGRKAGYGGMAEYSAILVRINDFPSGLQNPYASVIALVLPLAVIAFMFVASADPRRERSSRHQSGNADSKAVADGPSTRLLIHLGS